MLLAVRWTAFPRTMFQRSERDAKERTTVLPKRDNKTRDTFETETERKRDAKHTRHEHRSLATCGIELVARRLRLPTGWPRSYENVRVRTNSNEPDRSCTIHDGETRNRVTGYHGDRDLFPVGPYTSFVPDWGNRTNRTERR